MDVVKDDLKNDGKRSLRRGEVDSEFEISFFFLCFPPHSLTSRLQKKKKSCVVHTCAPLNQQH